MNPTALLKAEQLSFTYAEQHDPTLFPMDFALYPGQLVFLTGRSGSGKSTLLGIINGIIPDVFEGKIEGTLTRRHRDGTPVGRHDFAIGSVLQNPRSQFFSTYSTAELVFTMENLAFSKEKMQQNLASVVEEYKAAHLLDRNLLRLSSGERQLLALMTALIAHPDLLCFDEPSANLDYGHIMKLRRHLAALKAQGKSILIADHRCFYLRDLADQIWNLESGHLTVYTDPKRFDEEHRAARSAHLFAIPRKPRPAPRPSREDLCIRSLSFRDVLRDLTFSCRRGEITFIVGKNGAGKSTCARLLAGLLPPDSGTVRRSEMPLYLFQDADYQLFAPSCAEELSVGQKRPRQGAVPKKDETAGAFRKDSKNDKNDRNGRKENRKATPERLSLLSRLARRRAGPPPQPPSSDRILAAVNLADCADRHPQSLSGGQKQRLQIAVALSSGRSVWILDEPTSGLDLDSMERLVSLLDAAKEDHCIVVISHDYEFLVHCADRILYLKEGSLARDFPVTEATLPALRDIFEEMETSCE